MSEGVLFFVSSFFLGQGLAMDAFSVSVANGLNEPEMKKRRMYLIAGVFAGFQALMPMIGWFGIQTILQKFQEFSRLVPVIAFVLLSWIGIKMILEGLKEKQSEEITEKLTLPFLLIQGFVTSIDALSTGFAIAELSFTMALTAAFIISMVTFVVCMIGLWIGRKLGDKFLGKASIFGGMILVIIGLEILLTSIF